MVNSGEANTSDAQTPQPPSPKKRRKLTLRGALVAILIGVLVVTFNLSPLWRLCWRYGIYSFSNFRALADEKGVKHKTWKWIEGRTIRIYRHPEVRGGRTEEVASGVRALLDDAGLDFTVEIRPMPDDVLAAYNASLVEKTIEGGLTRTYISLGKLQSCRSGRVESAPCGEIIIAPHQIAEATWAYAMASFRGGMIILTDSHADHSTAKHETGHLMGYMMHDDFPIFVIGYPWEGWPWSRDTLMMLRSTDETLSPRARDALRSFWKGMEARTGLKFLSD